MFKLPVVLSKVAMAGAHSEDLLHAELEILSRRIPIDGALFPVEFKLKVLKIWQRDLNSDLLVFPSSYLVEGLEKVD